ncbi:fumarylacetoacetate hydrolase family protein [Novosphingobium flavum]|uniref:Fumarylacetoacetate hydrolase family protein n=1 Tax=Novosphingobium flavum TaxID=1778672 RepID=A0A7X1KN76_9SPHN|nr:fumarylacetoacetate hydrolase family protein [Novosphingobium flavum]MBC2667138.1 fumarylacetoacetate hydrolase family protein [Novosphingobium flavum]
MKFVRYAGQSGTPALGLLRADGARIAPLPAALSADADLVDIIAAGPAALAAANAAAANAGGDIDLASVTLLAPLHAPRRNVFCVGKNYYAHAQEFHKSGFDAGSAGSAAIPDAPIVFTKAATSISGPFDPIPGYLDETNSVDYEGELAVIIGKGGRGITKAEAMDHVFGFTVVNDVTARNLQASHKQWFLGKSIDGFCPMGPAVVTLDEIESELGGVGAMRLRTWVDGELRQDTQVSDLIFDIPTLIETISKRITLQPGDVIATGTPEGVGIGFTPPKFLAGGEVVRVEISGIGFIENTVEG